MMRFLGLLGTVGLIVWLESCARNDGTPTQTEASPPESAGPVVDHETIAKLATQKATFETEATQLVKEWRLKVKDAELAAKAARPSPMAQSEVILLGDSARAILRDMQTAGFVPSEEQLVLFDRAQAAKELVEVRLRTGALAEQVDTLAKTASRLISEKMWLEADDALSRAIELREQANQIASTQRATIEGQLLEARSRKVESLRRGIASQVQKARSSQQSFEGIRVPRSVPDRGSYYLLKQERIGNVVRSLHKRVGTDAVGFTLTETNCVSMEMRELGYSEVSPDDIRLQPTTWSLPVAGSSKSDLAHFVCDLTR